MQKKRTVLVTGGTGMIGPHLIRALLLRGDEVHLVTRDFEKLQAFGWEGKVTPHELDFCDPLAVRKLYQEVSPDEIYHLAASIMQWGVTEGLSVLTRVNILGTATLMEALDVIPSAHFVYPGSFAEIGGRAEPIREDHCPDPQEFYSISKLTGTLEGRQLARNKGFNIIIGRIFSAYGPGMPKGKLVEQVVSRALMNDDIILTHPEVSRDFIFVTDIVGFLMELAEKAKEYRGEIFNIASGNKTTLDELVQMTTSLTHSTSKVVWQPERRTDYERFPWQANMTKTHNALSYRPKVSLEEGILKTVAWIDEHPHIVPAS